MLKKITSALGLFIILVVHSANAWNFRGHVLVGQIAYNHLSAAEQVSVEQDAQALITKLPIKLKNQLNKFKGVSDFAKTMVLPDIWSDEDLVNIFQDLAVTPSDILTPYLHHNTASWHFYNKPYSSSEFAMRMCHTEQPYNVIFAITLMEKALQQTSQNNVVMRGLLNAFLGHYIADAHQPLHTFSRVNTLCQIDRGGNDFCLDKTSAFGKCHYSLHQLWDDGVGYLKHRRHLSKLVKRLDKEFPATRLQKNLAINNPTEWVAASFDLAPFIYSTMMGVKPQPAYYQVGQSIARKQLSLAGLRLAAVLLTTTQPTKP